MRAYAEDQSAHGSTGFEGRRSDPTELEAAIAELEAAVVESCDAGAEWPARVTAGIEAAVGFVAANPGAARTLTVDSRCRPEGEAGYPQLIERFAGLLGAGAPRSDRLSASSDESVVSLIAGIVSCHIRAGTVDALVDGDPDLVFLALLPYVGFAEASRRSSALGARVSQCSREAASRVD